jgi:hypothetical protein
MPDAPSGRPVSWGGFRALRPDLATIGREMFYEFGIGLGFLATVRTDGGPRVHPISPVLTDEALFALIVRGPKLADLRRDGRFALHSETFPPPRADDAFYITGTAYEVGDRDAWDRVAAQLLAEREGKAPWPGFETQVLFEFKLDRCLLTLTRGSNTFPAGHTIWHVP